MSSSGTTRSRGSPGRTRWRDRTRAVRTLRDEGRVERQRRRGKVARGVTVPRPTHRSCPVTDLVVADLGGNHAQHAALSGEQLVRLEGSVRGSGRRLRGGRRRRGTYERSLSPTEVDEDRGSRQAQLHQRQQRHAARKELGVVAVLGELRGRGVGRLGAARRRRRPGITGRVRIWSAAAGTDSTMLW